MQEIKETTIGKFRITVTDDKYTDRIVSKNMNQKTKTLYLEIYNMLRNELHSNLIFYVNPYLVCKEWGLGKRGLNIRESSARSEFKKLLWLTPYYTSNCVCVSYDYFDILKNLPGFDSTIPTYRQNREGIGHFADYEVYQHEFTETGKWLYIYIDAITSFHKVIDFIKRIGDWN